MWLDQSLTYVRGLALLGCQAYGIFILTTITRRFIMALLSFDNIVEAEDITEETVSVPEWGGEVVVRSISYRRMGKLKSKIAADKGVSSDDVADDDSEYEKQILMAGLVHPEVSEEQAEVLMDKSAFAVMKVLTAIMGSSKATAKELTEAEKNFPSDSE